MLNLGHVSHKIKVTKSDKIKAFHSDYSLQIKVPLGIWGRSLFFL